MGEVKESGNSEIEDFAAQMNGHPRDLLKRFTAGNHRPTEFSETAEDAEEIELNLGLSLGGCFGVEPKDKKLVRSSSIAGFMTPMRDDDAVAPPPVAFSALMRTCSLPTEVEEERRNRKELQSLRRMEAKRKRSEKQRNFREAKDRASLERNCEEDKLAEGEARVPISLKPKVEGNIGYPGYLDSLAGKQQQYMVTNGFSPSVTPSFGLPPWAASARGGVVTRGIDTVANGKNNGLPSAAGSTAGGGGGGAGGLQGFPPPSSQVSVGSQGSTSSGFSEFESRHGQESPASVQSLTENNEEKPIITLGTSSTDKSGKVAAVLTDNSSKKPKVVVENGTNEMGRNVMEEMPCVSTKGDGPNGRRIEGFLYRYRKGEEVRIVCVCHGSFLSPAEFVKHAGGGDVAHPLRHIVVNPTPSTFF